MNRPSTPPPPPATAYDPPITTSPGSPSGLPSPTSTPPQYTYPQPHPQRQLYTQEQRSYSQNSSTPLLRRTKSSLLDELLPTPTSASFPSSPSSESNRSQSLNHIIRRAGSVAVITIFLLSITFMASTTTVSPVGIAGTKGKASGLKQVFGVGNQADVGGWISQDVSSSVASTQNDNADQDKSQSDDGINETASETDSETEPGDQVRPDVDFDHYKMLKTLPPGTIDINSASQRLIFIGDIHGSYDPLLRLMDKISYSPSTDRLIHVGDLIAKGSKNEEVLWWMKERRVLGVRGNHDQAVIQWRGWMEWAGGKDWEAFVDSISFDDEHSALKEMEKQGKQWPKGWKWKGEHWKIARALPKPLYLYLLDLPLVLHLPTLHTIIVHAGLLPFDPLQPPSSPLQPLIQFSNVTSNPGLDAETIRNSEEISILFDVPQNSVPWNLINMRGVYMKGKKKGKVTKSGKKGKPWSEVWSKQMKRCKGAGKMMNEGMGELGAEQLSGNNEEIEDQEDNEIINEDQEEKRQKPGSPSVSQDQYDDESDLGCSPVTLIYGHAAGRGLDIKPFSKGLDTGCVYGRELTVLVLGDLKGLKGESVRVGDHQGILVSEKCGEGGI